MKEFLEYTYEGFDIYGAQINVTEQGLIITGGMITLRKKYFPERGESGIIQKCLINTDDSDVAQQWIKDIYRPVLPLEIESEE
jgi:hypothetical protein